MMRFLRELRAYIVRIDVLAAARFEPLKFSYFFQLHLFVAFILALALTPSVTDVVRSISYKLQKIPQGIVIEKKDAKLIITGIAQPYTFVDGSLVLSIDTTEGFTTRPASSTVFISSEALDVAQMGSQPAQRMLWKDGGDFKIIVDDVRNAVVTHEAIAVIMVTLLIFLYFFLSSGIFSVGLILVWSLVASLLYWIIFREKVLVRNVVALHMVAITGPLILWSLCVAAGFPIATVVEVFAFVVYSILGLRFEQWSKSRVVKK
jgi:Protein of unknown function (DUF1189)